MVRPDISASGPFAFWWSMIQSPFQKWQIGTCAWHILSLFPNIALNMRAGQVRPGLELRLTSILLSVAFVCLTFFSGSMSNTFFPQQGILLMQGVLALVSAIPAVILFASLLKDDDAHWWHLTWWYFATVIMPVPLSCLATIITSVYLKIYDTHPVKTSTEVTSGDTPLRPQSLSSDAPPYHEVSPSDGPMRNLYLEQIRGDTSGEATGNTSSQQGGGSWPPPYPWGKHTTWPRKEEQLPADFKTHRTKGGGRYFTHLSDTKPIWRDPRFRTGWTRFPDPDTGRMCYVDHNNRYTTWLKPAAPYLKGFDDDIFREWEKIWIRRANRFFFVNHRTGETTWNDPQSEKGKEKEFVDRSGDLPPGWEKCCPREGRDYFVCHNTQTTSWFDPRDSLPPLDDRWLQGLHYHDKGAIIRFLDTQTDQWSYKDPRRPEEPTRRSESPSSTGSGSGSSSSVGMNNVIRFKQRYLATRNTRVYALLSAIFLFAQGGIAITLALRLRIKTGVDWLIFVPWMPVLTGTLDLGITLTSLFFFFYPGTPTLDAITNHLSCVVWIASSIAMVVPQAMELISIANLRPRDMDPGDADDYLRVTRELFKWSLVVSCLSTLTTVLWIWHGYAFGRYRR